MGYLSAGKVLTSRLSSSATLSSPPTTRAAQTMTMGVLPRYECRLTSPSSSTSRPHSSRASRTAASSSFSPRST